MIEYSSQTKSITNDVKYVYHKESFLTRMKKIVITDYGKELVLLNS
jgi:hypothetical protein